MRVTRLQDLKISRPKNIIYIIKYEAVSDFNPLQECHWAHC